MAEDAAAVRAIIVGHLRRYRSSVVRRGAEERADLALRIDAFPPGTTRRQMAEALGVSVGKVADGLGWLAYARAVLATTTRCPHCGGTGRIGRADG